VRLAIKKVATINPKPANLATFFMVMILPPLNCVVNDQMVGKFPENGTCY
jgi:hypothetical protein